MPKYEVDHIDGSDSDLLARSIDSALGEFGVPIMQTLGVKKALTTTNEKLQCVIKEKNPVSRFGCNDYMAYHYSFMMKVATEQEE